jgi:hypothetical protein
VFLLLVILLIAHVRDRVAIAALAMTIMLAIKPAFVLMPVMFAIGGRWKLVGYTAIWLAAAGTISLEVFGWGPNVGFLENAARGLDATRLWTYNSSLPALVLNFSLLGGGDASTAAGAPEWIVRLAALTRIATAAFFVVLWRCARRTGMTPAATRNYVTLMAIAFFLLVSETIWEHYLVVLFIPATFVLARRARFSTGAVLTMAAALVLSAAQNLYVALTIQRLVAIDSIAEIVAVGLYKSGPLLLLLWFLIRYHDQFVASQPEARALLPGQGHKLI